MRDAPWWNTTRRKLLLSALGVSLLAVVFSVHVTHADSNGALADLGTWVLQNIISILQDLIAFLLSMVLFFITGLVSVAKYSNFVNAYPVTIGWVLVRDVVNMFFIVVLLVIAFSTIIGYEPFRYEKYLPKLLLMAVLVNFSKTLVGALIDFSQVLTITFVNGFQAAAAGNFINMFKLNGIVNLKGAPISPQSVADSQLDSNLNLFYSCLLGVLMLVITASVVGILFIYMVVRIIGLWILLIFSPIAFFALALPDKIQGSLTVFTKEWWGRLTALISGGPIVAFFLWLALATAQGGNGTFSQVVTQNESAADQANVHVGIADAGTPEQLGGFAVAIIMLLMGLQQALSSTKAVSDQAVPLAKAVGGLALGAAKGAARRSVQVGAWTGQKAFNKFDATTKLSENIGKGAANRARNLSAIAQNKDASLLQRASAGFSASIYGAIGNSAARVSGARKEAYSKNAEEKLKGLSTSQQIAYLESNAAALTTSKEEKAILLAKARKLTLTRTGQEVIKKDLEAEYDDVTPAVKRGKSEKESDFKLREKENEENKKTFVEARLKERLADLTEKSKTYAKDTGDEETFGKLEDEQEKDASKSNDLKDIKKNMQKTDMRTVLRTKKVDSFRDIDEAIAALLAAGVINERGEEIPGYDDPENEAYQELMKSKERREIIEQQRAFLDTATGKEHMKLALAVMHGDESKKDAALNSRHYLTKSGEMVNVKTGKFADMTVTRTPPPPPEHQVNLNEVDITESEVIAGRRPRAGGGSDTVLTVDSPVTDVAAGVVGAVVGAVVAGATGSTPAPRPTLDMPEPPTSGSTPPSSPPPPISAKVLGQLKFETQEALKEALQEVGQSPSEQHIEFFGNRLAQPDQIDYSTLNIPKKDALQYSAAVLSNKLTQTIATLSEELKTMAVDEAKEQQKVIKQFEEQRKKYTEVRDRAIAEIQKDTPRDQKEFDIVKDHIETATKDVADRTKKLAELEQRYAAAQAAKKPPTTT